MAAPDALQLSLIDLVGFGAALVVGVALLRVAVARRRATRRVVERPNSHYTAPLALDAVTRHRWHEIDLGRVHEINRGEVLRLLARVEVSGARALTGAECAFLERMLELAPPRAKPKPRDSGAPPHLRARHA